MTVEREPHTQRSGTDPGRTRAETGLAIFCAATLGFLVYRDLALPHVGRVEVWLGFEVRDFWARATAPLHWAIYAGAALGFWRAWPPIWRLAIGYSIYVAVSHLVWNLTSPTGGGVRDGLLQLFLFSIPTLVLIRFSRGQPER